MYNCRFTFASHHSQLTINTYFCPMTPYEFTMLGETEKVDLIYSDGIYVGKRKKNLITIVLYQIDSFYAEVFYRKYRYSVSRIRCFTSTLPLDPYLEQIDVEELIKC